MTMKILQTLFARLRQKRERSKQAAIERTLDHRVYVTLGNDDRFYIEVDGLWVRQFDPDASSLIVSAELKAIKKINIEKL